MDGTAPLQKLWLRSPPSQPVCAVRCRGQRQRSSSRVGRTRGSRPCAQIRAGVQSGGDVATVVRIGTRSVLCMVMDLPPNRLLKSRAQTCSAKGAEAAGVVLVMVLMAVVNGSVASTIAPTVTTCSARNPWRCAVRCEQASGVMGTAGKVVVGDRGSAVPVLGAVGTPTSVGKRAPSGEGLRNDPLKQSNTVD